MTKTETSMQIVICKECKGTGKIKDPLWPAEEDYKVETCPGCGGEGMVLEIYSIKREKLTPKKKEEFFNDKIV